MRLLSAEGLRDDLRPRLRGVLHNVLLLVTAGGGGEPESLLVLLLSLLGLFSLIALTSLLVLFSFFFAINANYNDEFKCLHMPPKLLHVFQGSSSIQGRICNMRINPHGLISTYGDLPAVSVFSMNFEARISISLMEQFISLRTKSCENDIFFSLKHIGFAISN